MGSFGPKVQFGVEIWDLSVRMEWGAWIPLTVFEVGGRGSDGMG